MHPTPQGKLQFYLGLTFNLSAKKTLANRGRFGDEALQQQQIHPFSFSQLIHSPVQEPLPRSNQYFSKCFEWCFTIILPGSPEKNTGKIVFGYWVLPGHTSSCNCRVRWENPRRSITGVTSKGGKAAALGRYYILCGLAARNTNPPISFLRLFPFLNIARLFWANSRSFF